MNKKIYSFFAVMGMAIAMGTAAFTAPKKSSETLYWFEVQNDQVMTSSYIGSNPGAECDLPLDPLNEVCAAAFTESEIGNPSSPIAPTNDIHDAEELSYKKRNPQ